MSEKIKQFDNVTVSLDAVILDEYGDGSHYMVEIFDDKHQTIDTVMVSKDRIKTNDSDEGWFTITKPDF